VTTEKAAGGGTVVDFQGEERYSTPLNPWGSSVTICYRLTLPPNTPAPVPLHKVDCSGLG
jgi:hypothetical protein